HLVSFSLLLRRRPRPPLFPYTTLFRSPRPTTSSHEHPSTRRPSASPWRSAPPSAGSRSSSAPSRRAARCARRRAASTTPRRTRRSEEHTSELQSLRHLVCRLLLEKKKK